MTACNRRLFPTIKRNDFWTDVLALGPIGAITHINNRNHLTHHASSDAGRSGSPQARVFQQGRPSGTSGVLIWIRQRLEFREAVFLTRGRENLQKAPAGPAASSYTPRDFVILASWFGCAGWRTHLVHRLVGVSSTLAVSGICVHVSWR